MAHFELFLVVGVALLFITLIVANEGLPRVCPDDLLICPDGTSLSRDPLNDCEFPECPGVDFFPYCSEGVLTVWSSDSLIETVGDDLVVYGEDVVFNCSESSAECRAFSLLNWSLEINCTAVNLTGFNVFSCPENYFIEGDYKWINCERGVFEEFVDYCEPRYRQWIEFNCGIDMIN